MENMGLKDEIREQKDERGVYYLWDYKEGEWKKNKGIRIEKMMMQKEEKKSLI